MAEIIPSVIAYLGTRADIAEIFGNRITGEFIPDGQAYPHAVITEITGPPRYGHFGESGRVVTIQIDIFGETQAATDAAKLLIINALSGYRGMMGTLNVGRVFVTDIRGSWDAEKRKPRRVLEVSIGTNN